MKSSSLQTTIANATITAIQLLNGIQIARGLGPYSRGELSLLTAWAPAIALMFAGGLTDALSHKIGQTKNSQQKDELVSATRILILGLSLIGVMITLVFTKIYVNERLPQYASLAILFLLIIPMTNISNMNMAIDLAQAKVGHYNFSRLTQTVVYFLITMWALNFLSDPIPAIVLATLFQCAIPIFFNLKHLFVNWSHLPPRAAITSMWQSSLPLWPGVAFSYLATQADRLTGTLFLNFADLGIFHVAQSLSITMLSVLSYTPFLLIHPAASRIDDTANRQNYIIKQISFWNLIIMLFTIVVATVGYLITPLLLGTEFKATALAIAILTPGHAALMARMMAGRSIRSIGHSSVAPMAEIVFLSLLAITSIFIYRYATMSWLALAFVTCICSCISSLCFFYSLAKRFNVSPLQFIDAKINIVRLYNTVVPTLRG